MCVISIADRLIREKYNQQLLLQRFCYEAAVLYTSQAQLREKGQCHCSTQIPENTLRGSVFATLRYLLQSYWSWRVQSLWCFETYRTSVQNCSILWFKLDQVSSKSLLWEQKLWHSQSFTRKSILIDFSNLPITSRHSDTRPLLK